MMVVLYVGDGGALADFIDALLNFGVRDALQFGDESEICGDLHFRVERGSFGQVADAFLDLDGLLEDIETGDAGLSRRGRKKAGEDAHRRRFPGAVLAEESDDLALTHFEGDVFDRDIASVSLGQAFDFDHSVICLTDCPDRVLRRRASPVARL